MPLPEPEAEPEAPAADGPMIGSDESGKGDYFGPLVVAAVRDRITLSPSADLDRANLLLGFSWPWAVQPQ